MAIDLPELSAKICGIHGTHRSQYLKTAITEVNREMHHQKRVFIINAIK